MVTQPQTTITSQIRATLNNASHYRTNRLYRTPNPNSSPIVC